MVCWGGDMNDDWQHLFSFGTHNNNGGDAPVAPLAYYGTRNKIPGCTLNVELPKHGLNIEDVWNNPRIQNFREISLMNHCNCIIYNV